ncbi:MAG: hypothetical protein CK532_04355 [Flavobacteriales bacterium]|nr:MAG: hypothetical protein CK532_04355 [Flavobacteriales bacterium]
MKKISILVTIGFALLVGVTSCKKEINDINKTNPNQFSGADASLMLTGAQLANVMLNEGESARTAGIFCGYFKGADRQYLSYSDYSMTAGDFNSGWSTAYINGLAQCRIIRAAAAKSNNKVLMAVSSITEAHLLLTLSGLWGDIPNTQACTDGINEPKYDKMSDVHKYCIDLLDSSMGKASGNVLSVAYAGSFKWDEVANTLKARALLRMKNYAGAAAAAAKGIKKGGDMYANHTTESPGAWNIFYDFLDYNRGGYLGCDGSFIAPMLDTAAKTLAMSRNNSKTTETGRFYNYFYNGKYSYTNLDPNFFDGIFTPTSNYTLVSHAENELILAECNQRLGNSVAALVNLNNVRADLNATYGTYMPYDIADFGPGALIKGATASEAMLKEICCEKYVSLFGQIETYCDVRRSGNIVGITPYKGASLPARFLYPQQEINSNKNTPKGFGLFDALELFK